MKLTTLGVSTLAAAALGLGACGGTDSTTASDSEFLAAAPTYATAALQISDADAIPPQAAPQGGGQELTAAAPACHPHLFQRTQEVVSLLNHHFNKHLAHFAELIARTPSLKTDGEHVWEKVANGVDRKLTITRKVNGDGSVTFDILLQAGPTGGALVTLASGDLTSIKANASSTPPVLGEEKGSLTYDFDALKSVYKNEKATGQIKDVFDRLRDPSKGGAHVRRTSTITFVNFVPEAGDPHGARNGSYAWVAEPGIGGSFSFADSLILLCPANPHGLYADVTTVSRWYRTASGGVAARTDAKASGGQIPAGDRFVGVTCAASMNSGAPGEAYWMMKEENASGGTISGDADTSGSAPCDPAFGAVPALQNDATDYDFGKPVTFPNQW